MASSSSSSSSSSVLCPLSPGVREKLRSGQAGITSPGHCVQEMVHNSLDSGCSKVDIAVDLPCFKIKVADDGRGMGWEDLRRVAERYHTSKCATLADLWAVKTLGYRGEALASLRDTAGYLQIVSKRTEDSEAGVALFIRGQRRKVSKYLREFDRPNGTTVSVLEFLYDMPVRQRLVSPALDLEDVRQSVCALALAHPAVAFSLVDESARDTVLETSGKAETPEEAFAALFGREWLSSLKAVDATEASLRLKGFVADEAVSNKEKQFLFVNGRFVKKGALHKAVREALRKSVMCRPQQQPPPPADQERLVTESPTKSARLHPVFCLDLGCPPTDCDLLLEPRKTSVEFADWETVSSFVARVLADFLKANCLLPPNAMAALSKEELANLPVPPSLLPFPTHIAADVTGIDLLLSQDEEEPCGGVSDEGGEVRRGGQDDAGGGGMKGGDLLSDYFVDTEGARVSRVVRRPQQQDREVDPIPEDEEDGDDGALREMSQFKASGDEGGASSTTVPQGWIRKDTDCGRTYYVNLASGITVDSPSKCSRPLSQKRRAGSNSISAKLGKRARDSESLLPTGKTPFLPAAGSGRRQLERVTVSSLPSPSSSSDACSPGDGGETFAHSKWRNADESVGSDCSRGKSASEILSSWQNPNFAYEDGVFSLRKADSGAVGRQAPRPFRFERSMFDGLSVKGQVDKKFIAATVWSEASGGERILVFFDQHAVHERIRLEALIQEHYPAEKKEVLSADLDPALSISLTSDEVRLLSKFRDTTAKLGLGVTFPDPGSSSTSVTRAPVCFLQREASEFKNRRPSPLRDLVVATLRDVCRALKETRGPGCAANLLPPTIFNVLCSQACRSAIKFGDGLSPGACRRLLRQLSSCHAPFQCAHGRPSVAPIASVTGLTDLTTSADSSSKKINLINLRAMMAAEEDDGDVGGGEANDETDEA